MENSATDWAAVKAVFHEASELAPGARAAFVASACAGNSALQREVESLLARADTDPAFLETPVVSLLAAAERADATAPRLIGPYSIAGLIGRGGMGTVYAATRADDVYQRRVAIKVVNRGMDTEDVVERFRAERQTLARLDHPNIARIIDGGATGDGLPYFVMDYVDGVPIDSYCDRARLTIPRRIDLFRSVCSAVSYAHQNLVVHRDLKPENILVTGDGVVKLLDFGVAKLLDGGDSEPRRDVTRLPERRMTLSHASPEQVRGLPITTTSDVYSLGVLLYTLLCGHRPYRVSDVSSDEAARTICEVTGRPPSTWLETALVQDINAPTPEAIASARGTNPNALRRELAGDPDRIVAMALRKEPERRYGSVELLSEDLHRYLRGLPVMARADTFGYRTQKFARRHRVGVVAAGVAGLALAGGVATTLWQARVAQAERRIAERRFNDVRALANSLVFELYDAIQFLPGSTPARELLVRRALDYVETTAREAADDHALQLELAIAYLRIGDVQGNPTNANLGDVNAAETSYGKAMALLEPLLTATDVDAHVQVVMGTRKSPTCVRSVAIRRPRWRGSRAPWRSPGPRPCGAPRSWRHPKTRVGSRCNGPSA